nr:MAG TPA: hypothetical protein [Caudoviricetes sp.]
MPPMCGRIITARLATLAELKTTLTFEDAANLDECLLIENYHNWLAQMLGEENGRRNS